MVTREQCQRYVGQWIQFRTQYGSHIGYLERVTKDAAIVLSPSRFVPAQLASAPVGSDDARLDVALAWWGGLGGGYPAGAYAGPGGFGPYGGWGWGWRRWAVSFLIIYVLWGLLWW
ncbi:MAG: hypothetical protein K6T30_03755 [Alicyclobacillus sp.]|nr:hypothetical protein [Alicyclobacillus sp.]